MLQLARVQSGNLSMNLQEFPVSSALTTCVEAHAAIGASKGVTVTLLPLPDRLAIYSDLDAFQTIMNNLISNAVRYTESGGRVLVSATQSDGVVRFQVRDTGIGIPQEDQARIFERFYRVEKARTTDRGGTGLGLAIVKNLVVALGGTIRVESEVGKGSLFELQLPAPSQSA
jgi:two-component system phosphate regulon sensor histidine kinase PhoR